MTQISRGNIRVSTWRNELPLFRFAGRELAMTVMEPCHPSPPTLSSTPNTFPTQGESSTSALRASMSTFVAPSLFVLKRKTNMSLVILGKSLIAQGKRGEGCFQFKSVFDHYLFVLFQTQIIEWFKNRFNKKNL